MKILKRSNPFHWVIAAYRIIRARVIMYLRFKAKRPQRGYFEWTDGYKSSVKFTPDPNGDVLIHNANMGDKSRISIDIRKQYPLIPSECFQKEQ